MTNYIFETFEPTISQGAPEPKTANFIQAVRAGFHDKSVTGDKLLGRVKRAVADKRVFTAAYADSTLDHALSADIPVATFAHFEKDVNVGGGTLIPAHLITWVTVRPTHRRRGLLRRLMTDNLTHAHDAGYPFAALTVSEGGIYSRFGFGAASWLNHIEVDTSPGFALIGETDRRVEICEASALADLAPAIYSRFQKYSPGAMGRQQVLYDVAAGHNIETDEADAAVRGALHYDEAGQPDGFVSYKYVFKENWSQGTLELLDFIAVTNTAYAALWDYLGAVDLTTTVKYHAAAQQSPLPWLLTDPRRVKVVKQVDGIWLRILDVAKALEARAWLVGGELTLRIHDDMGFVDGTYVLESDGQRAHVTKLDGATSGAIQAAGGANHRVDLEMNVSELGSIYLGGADPVVLARAGRITEVTPGAALQARSLFALERAPYTPNDF